MAKEYPLEQLVEIKKKRFEEAVKILEEKTEILKKEEKKLKELEEKRDEMILHKQEKLNQLYEMFDEGITSDKIEQMEHYLEVVDEKILDRSRKVDRQKETIKKAEAEVEKARQNLFAKRKDVEKLDIHKKEWAKELQLEMAQEEAKEHDELGASMHERRRKKLTK